MSWRCVSLALLTTLSTPLAGQRTAPPMASWSADLATPAPNQTRSVAFAPEFGDPKDYRYEGAIAGAVVFGAGAFVLSGLCDSDCGAERAEMTVGGIVAGGLFGLLIGGMMTKAGDK